MKLRKIFVYLIMGVVTLGLVTGCTDTTKTETSKKEEEKVQGKCKVEECIKLIEPSNTIEEINEIIGFEAEKSEYSETYKWKLSDKTWIDATPSTSDESYSLSANYDKSTIKNDKAVKITPNLLIKALLIPVRLINEVIIAITTINIKNIPIYFKYSKTLYIKSP